MDLPFGFMSMEQMALSRPLVSGEKTLSCRFFLGVYHKLQTLDSNHYSRPHGLVKVIPLVQLTLFAQNGRHEDAKEPVLEA